jgi:hypothetical protein
MHPIKYRMRPIEYRMRPIKYRMRPIKHRMRPIKHRMRPIKHRNCRIQGSDTPLIRPSGTFSPLRGEKGNKPDAR